MNGKTFITLFLNFTQSFSIESYRGIVGFYVAQAVGDDIYLYNDEAECHSNGTNPRAILHGLRQQAEVDSQLHYQVHI